MKRKTLLILDAVLLAAVFSFDACKKADIVTATLTVLVSEGVSGIPEAGVYNLDMTNPLQYSFTLKEGYSKLTVLLDGAAIAASGTLTISGVHTLQAYADDHFEYALTVTVTDGISGTPTAGTFNYGQGSLVNYSYAIEDGFFDLVVTLDGVTVESSGTITMSAAHKLSASATAGKNIRGTWLLRELYDDGSSFEVTATFSGAYAAGSVIDSDGGSGAYTLTGATVAFTLVFPAVNYEYSGSFSDNDTMSGTCKRYQTADSVIRGTWGAIRKTTATAAAALPAGAVERIRKGDVEPGEKQ
ncbi:MAG: hypothetical protein WCL37_04995 [Chrysiogenales bacterium]